MIGNMINILYLFRKQHFIIFAKNTNIGVDHISDHSFPSISHDCCLCSYSHRDVDIFISNMLLTV